MYKPTDQELDVELAERIEDAIKSGIRQGQTETKRRRKQWKIRVGGAIAGSVVICSFILTIMVSPVFASMVSDIPGLQRFVELINKSSDKGIQLALDNDFIQPVGVSDEHEGIKFTVQGIIVDDSRMVVFYDIQMAEQDKPVQLDSLSLSDPSGKKLPTVISYNDFPEEVDKEVRSTGNQQGTVDFQISEGSTLPDKVVLTTKLRVSEVQNAQNMKKEMRTGTDGIPSTELVDSGAEFTVNITIDQARFAGLRQEYLIGETIQVEGQNITFAKAVISPLRISVYLDYDKENSQQIFGPGDIQLVDDKGTVWKNTLASMEKDHPVYHFESPYFNEPKSLTIEGTWFRALDKNKMSVIIDTEKGKILQSPDKKLDIHSKTTNNLYTKLDFTLKGIDKADNMMYSMFEEEFRDADGKLYKELTLHESTRGYSRGPKQIEQHSLFYIDNNVYKQPLTFTIFDYPTYIRKPYKIRIK
jgi:hypothetical protein